MAARARRRLLALLLACAWSLARARPAPDRAASPAWRRHFANDSVTGREVPCTRADRFCLARGWLHHPPDGKCYLYGDRGPCAWDEKLRVDKRELLRASGRVVAACVKRYLCDEPGRFRMAADGSCLDHAALREVCYAQPGLRSSENLFGETECSCAGEDCPVKQQQPVELPSQEQVGVGEDEGEGEGVCKVPALGAAQLPLLPWAAQAASPRAAVPCSRTERRCFLDGRVYLAERDLCFELWRRGPCAPGHWLLLDRDEAVNGSGRLVGVCRALPCGAGRVLSASDGACRTPEELCGAYAVAFDAYGAAACSAGPDSHLRWPTARGADGLCRYPAPGDDHPLQPLDHDHDHDHHEPPAPPAPPACPDAHTGYCQRHVHRRPAPTP